MNNNIDPILYNVYLGLHDHFGAIIVHRRHRKSNTSIEIIFTSPAIKEYTGRLNTLKEAEACGYWVISRRQTKGKHLTWRGHAVFQLFLSPVHPKKRHEALLATAQTAVQQLQTTSNDLKQLQTTPEDITFEPIIPRPSLPSRTRIFCPSLAKKSSTSCISQNFFVPLQPQRFEYGSIDRYTSSGDDLQGIGRNG
jgi:hypothetical protein